MSILDTMASKIIREQALVIGPLAWSEAEKVNGLIVIDAKKAEVSISSTDSRDVVNRLVSQYERLFGKASRETCRQAVASIIADLSPSEIPSSLLAA